MQKARIEKSYESRFSLSHIFNSYKVTYSNENCEFLSSQSQIKPFKMEQFRPSVAGGRYLGRAGRTGDWGISLYVSGRESEIVP